MPKINFIIHFFLEILNFKKSCNLIGWQHFGPLLENQNFVRYGIAGKISATILVSILGYFQEKLMTKFFQKPYFGSILGSFYSNLGKKDVCWKKRSLSDFRYSNYLPSCQKSEKIKEPFLRKMLNWRTDWQTTVILLDSL